MHPEIVSDKPGTCPKCGMKLVQKTEPKLTVIHSENSASLGPTTWKSYIPLVVIIGMLVLVSGLLYYKDALLGAYPISNWISYFMIGFFLTFSTFKLMDLEGFKEGYSTYDLLAQRAPAYGYVYPFIEIFFGLAMIFMPHSTGLLVAEIIVMTFSGLGVAIKLAKREPFVCACLGTFLKVPLTKVTLIEDFGMAGLALLMLLLK